MSVPTVSGRGGRRLRICSAVTLLAIGSFAQVLAQGKPVTGGASSPAAALFDQECAGCHAQDGHGVVTMPGMPDLRNPAFQKQWSDEQLTGAIVNGNGLMPTFKEALSAEQVRSLVSYVRGLPVSPALPRQERTSCATCHGAVAPGAAVPGGGSARKIEVASRPKPQT
jgi:mono/diheme cytochrome c family protein